MRATWTCALVCWERMQISFWAALVLHLSTKTVNFSLSDRAGQEQTLGLIQHVHCSNYAGLQEARRNLWSSGLPAEPNEASIQRCLIYPTRVTHFWHAIGDLIALQSTARNSYTLNGCTWTETRLGTWRACELATRKIASIMVSHYRVFLTRGAGRPPVPLSMDEAVALEPGDILEVRRLTTDARVGAARPSIETELLLSTEPKSQTGSR
jgi:hypothetical protein